MAKKPEPPSWPRYFERIDVFRDSTPVLSVCDSFPTTQLTHDMLSLLTVILPPLSEVENLRRSIQTVCSEVVTAKSVARSAVETHKQLHDGFSKATGPHPVGGPDALTIDDGSL